MIFMERYKEYISNIEIDNIYQQENRKTENYNINNIRYIHNDYFKDCMMNMNLVDVNGRDFICNDQNSMHYWHYYDSNDYGITIKQKNKMSDYLKIYIRNIICLGENCQYISIELKHQLIIHNIICFMFKNITDSNLEEITKIITKIVKTNKRDPTKTQYSHYVNDKYITTINEIIQYIRGAPILSIFDWVPLY
jgi:hypothetical protein